jgi:hypothetical protein
MFFLNRPKAEFASDEDGQATKQSIAVLDSDNVASQAARSVVPAVAE